MLCCCATCIVDNSIVFILVWFCYNSVYALAILCLKCGHANKAPLYCIALYLIEKVQMAVLRLQTGQVEGYPPDTVQMEGGDLLVVGQLASSAPAQRHRSLTEPAPARLKSALMPRLIRDCQLPRDAQVPEIT